ncbi:BQ2448_3071 [Microbotryum intermedium]|uniref:BQ2448_3071 protein n=1 Tax=Microbotryum intermedium TaxID=269621 RepID=A0A238FHL4_9BASI|nr:BQ2448_3071 [Microbotryum intermedium]
MATTTKPNSTPTIDPPVPQDPNKLNFDELGDANRRAQIDVRPTRAQQQAPASNLLSHHTIAPVTLGGLQGIVSGAAAAFLAGQFSTRLLKQGRNAGLLSGLIAGVGVGYLMTGHSLSIYLHQAQQSRLALRARLAETSEGSKLDPTSPQPWDLNRGEGGVGGMELMTDKYRSTSGDH